MSKVASVCFLVTVFASSAALAHNVQNTLSEVAVEQHQSLAQISSTPPAYHDSNTHKHEHEHEHVLQHDNEDLDHAATEGDNYYHSTGEAHVHGKAQLTLVLEGNEMQLAFQSAAYNVVGFEHKPTTTEQKQEVAAAIEIFNKGNWFSVNSEANCELSLAEASTDLTAIKAIKGHADFYANYQLLCQRPARLNSLSLTIFSLIPALAELDVQWIINGNQGAATATLTQSTLRF